MKSYKLKIIVLLFYLLFFTSGCTPDMDSYCLELKQKAEQEEFIERVRNWASENIAHAILVDSDILIGGGMGPGKYWLQSTINWDLFGFNADAQVRLIGKSLDEIKSVFFGEFSGYGYILRLPQSSDFGVKDEYLTLVAPDFGIYCQQRD